MSTFLLSTYLTVTVSNKIPKSRQNQALISPMVTTTRSTCPSCSKPASVCLCSRLRTPLLHNSVAVTIFQHSLEKNHPLNSTRIAKIGLKNVDVVTVSDVHVEARFCIRLLDSSFDGDCHLFDEMPSKGKIDEFLETAADADLDERITETNELNGDEENFRDPELCALNFTIARSGTISSLSNCKIGASEMSFDQVLASDAAVNELRKGFIVKKLQKKVFGGLNEFIENEEFEIVIVPGSVLLFPSESSVDVEAVDFEVKNLIVLDGTWAKAKRMYMENPWLRLLPHIRLNVDKLSLYGEVRTQPKAGYLSTIESIVYAMKAVGEDAQGLDGLLEVFESMVGDQRRYKDERPNATCNDNNEPSRSL